MRNTFSNHYAVIYDISELRRILLSDQRLAEEDINHLIKLALEYYLFYHHQEHYIDWVGYRGFPIEYSQLAQSIRYPYCLVEYEYRDIVEILTQQGAHILDDIVMHLFFIVATSAYSTKRLLDIQSIEAQGSQMLIHFILK